MTDRDISETLDRQAGRPRPLQMAAPKAIVFDLDDTLLMLMGTVRPAWERVYRDLAGELEGISADDFHAAVEAVSRTYWGDRERHRERRLDMERSRREVAHGVVARLGLSTGPASRPSDTGAASPDRLADRLAEGYSDHRQSLERPFPGAVETLDALE